MLEVRVVLEAQGAAWAAERADQETIAVMAKTIEDMREDGLSTEALIALDFDFHLRLHEASKNAALVALVQAIRSMVLDTIVEAWTFNPRRETRLEEHSRILAAVAAQDSAAARAAMEEHLYHSRLRQKLERGVVPT
jgi:GntR family transcriptional repressor for pyruvate dehydrogenase complex